MQGLGDRRVVAVGLRHRALRGSIGIGRGSGSPVSAAFDVPSAFTGTIEKVTVTL